MKTPKTKAKLTLKRMATYPPKKNESIKILKKYQEKYKVIHKKTIQSTK